jgi:hypothetical protein
MMVTSAALANDRLTVQLEKLGPHTETPLSVLLEADCSGGEASSSKSVLTDTVDIQVSVEDLPCQLQATAEGYWSPTTIVEEPDPKAVQIRLWPAGTVGGKLVSPDDIEPPSTVRFRFLAPSRDDGDEPLIVLHTDCPTSNGRISSCTVPAGTWHMRLKTETFAPVHFWGVRVKERKRLDLGDVTLTQGATLVGQVLAAGEETTEGTEVLLRHISQPSRTWSNETEILSEAASVNEWGYFSFTGLHGGVYKLILHKPGYIAPIPSPVRAQPGQLVELDKPLILKPAARLHLEVLPETTPSGAAWQTRIIQGRIGDSNLEPRDSGETTNGTWSSKWLAEGKYLAVVEHESIGQVALSELDLQGGEQQLRIDVDLLEIHGEVLFGDEALSEADVTFSKLPTVTTNRKGEFRLLLPHLGTWEIEVRQGFLGISRRMIKEIENEDGAASSSVVLRIPDTLLHGEVVDPTGAPVPEAHVYGNVLGIEESMVADVTDADGWFQVRGVHEGLYSLHAKKATPAGLRQSASARELVRESSTPPPVRLVLQDSWSVAGVVTGDGVPVINARVLAIPADPGGRVSQVGPIPSSQTDMNGSFSLEIPSAALSAQLIIEALGHAYHVQRLYSHSLEPGQAMQIALEDATGTLELGPASDLTNLVMVRGHGIPRRMLMRWAHDNGSTVADDGNVRVPSMPPGQYAYCRVTPQELMLVCGGGAIPKQDACTSGQLIPGGTLNLRLPDRPE